MWIIPKTGYYGQYGSLPAGTAVEVSEGTIAAIQKELNRKRSAMPKEDRELIPSFAYDVVPAPWDSATDKVLLQLASLRSDMEALQAKRGASIHSRDKAMLRVKQLTAHLQDVGARLAQAEEKGNELTVTYMSMDADRINHEISAAEIQTNMDQLTVQICEEGITEIKEEMKGLTSAADAAGQNVPSGPDQGPAEGTPETTTATAG